MIKGGRRLLMKNKMPLRWRTLRLSERNLRRRRKRSKKRKIKRGKNSSLSMSLESRHSLRGAERVRSKTKRRMRSHRGPGRVESEICLFNINIVLYRN